MIHVGRLPDIQNQGPTARPFLSNRPSARVPDVTEWLPSRCRRTLTRRPAQVSRPGCFVICMRTVLAEGEYKAGHYAIGRNGHAGRGALPAGIYFLRFRAGGLTFVHRPVVAH